MKNIFVVAQLHGSYSTLIKYLKKINFDFESKDDVLIVLGNFFGYGSEQIKLFNFLRELKKREKAIILRGAEEDFFIHRDDFFPLPLKKEALNLELNKSELLNEIKLFLNNCPYFFETKNYIFVSAGINPNLNNWRETKKTGTYWNDSMIWMFNDQLNRLKNGDFKKNRKTVITGFVCSSKYHFFIKNGFLENYSKPIKNLPFKKDNFVNIGGSWHYENNRIIYLI